MQSRNRCAEGRLEQGDAKDGGDGTDHAGGLDLGAERGGIGGVGRGGGRADPSARMSG